MNTIMDIDELVASLSDDLVANKTPPVLDWHPDQHAEIDIRIDTAGEWFHEGRVIERSAMVRLFSTVMRKDADGYCLITPQLKLKIVVEDAPFVAVNMEAVGEGKDRRIAFATNVGDFVPLDSAHPISIVEKRGNPKPYIIVRNGLEALLSRPVYYRLAELCEADPDADATFGVWSNNHFFILDKPSSTYMLG